MTNVVADKWHVGHAYIIGDAAHQFPPSGGYGLNTGISDAFSLAWRLAYSLKGVEDNSLMDIYERERVIYSNVRLCY